MMVILGPRLSLMQAPAKLNAFDGDGALQDDVTSEGYVTTEIAWRAGRLGK
jgi:hypothetical protein